MTGTYNISLVVFSFAIAVVASYTALDLAGRVQSALKWRRFWLLGGAVVMGTGIWSMHFVAMLAFQLPVPVSYSIWITLLSLLCAITASGIALLLLSQSSIPLLFGGGVCMGIAIAWMHYTGMAAMELQARIEYDWGLVGLSVAIAVSAAFAALKIAFRLQNESLKQRLWQKLGSALVMGVAISGMHYTGMWATCFIPLHKLPAEQIPAPRFNQFWLAIAIGVATLFILSLALLTSVFEQRLTAQLVREQALQESEKRLGMLVDEMQQAEAALQRSNTRYQNLAQNVPGMIYQVVLHPDGSGAFLYVSPGCREIFGLEPEALMENATLFWQIAHPDDVGALQQSIEDSARTLQFWDYVWRIFVSGQIRWLRGNSRPELQPDGSIIWDGVITDITARQQAEEVLRESAQRERAITRVVQQMRSSLDLETIFSSTTQELRQAIKCDRVLVYRFNPDWSGEFVSESVAAGWNVLLLQQINQPELNQTAVDKAGCAVKTLSGEVNLFQDTYLQETQAGIYRQGVSHTCVSDIYEAGYDSCYLELLERFQARAYIVVPIFCGHQLWGLLATYQNSGPRAWKVAEINMVVQIGSQLGVAIQQAELLAQTQRQAEELQKAKLAADVANRAKSNFLAHMSHELRTPLNAILGFTQLMNRSRSLSGEHQQYLDIVSRSGEHLLQLINDVLEMSKIEAGRTTLNETDFDLHRLLGTLEEMLQLKACVKGLQLTFEWEPEVPQYVKTDESKLSQVLLNLMGNAIKFTQQGYVNLRVSLVNSDWSLAKDKGPVVRENGKMTIHFEVEDTGPGIAPNEVKKLFKPFEQTETGLKSIEGTGLGLAISQNFVQLMGGEISVNSQPGVGSLFSFDIQVSPVQALVENISQPIGRQVIGLAPGQPTYRILVAEDNPTDRLLLVKLLSTLGFDVHVAQQGNEVLVVWEQWEPHLIWMDMRMPVMDGYEVTKRIKASLKGQATVVIALTANAFESQRQNSLLAGCDDFLRKPFEQEELLAKLSQHLGVQYVYEEEEKKKKSDPFLPLNLQSDIKIMPATWVEQLYSAALQCNDHLIFSLLTQIPSENSSLAVALTNLAENFQFDQITSLIQHVKTL